VGVGVGGVMSVDTNEATVSIVEDIKRGLFVQKASIPVPFDLRRTSPISNKLIMAAKVNFNSIFLREDLSCKNQIQTKKLNDIIKFYKV
jgi:hypothetical protein